MSISDANQQVPELINTCEELLRISPHFSEVRHALGRLYIVEGEKIINAELPSHQSNKNTEALQYWEKAISLGQDSHTTVSTIEGYLKCAHLMHRNGDDAKAQELLHKALEVLPSSPGHDDLRALIHYFEKILQQHPAFEILAGTKTILSRLYFKLGDHLITAYASVEDLINLNQSVEAFKRGLAIEPVCIDQYYIDTLRTLAFLLHQLGRQAECNQYIAHALTYEEQNAKEHPVGRSGVRIFTRKAANRGNIGHLISEPEFFLKMRALGWIPPYRGVFLAPYDEVVNRCALNYWRPHLCVITDPGLVRRFLPLASKISYDAFWLKLPNSKPAYLWSAMMAVQKQWETEQRGPLLKLEDEHRERGWACLESLGVPRGSWFVTLHVRDQSLGKNGELVNGKPTANRDANIETYFPALQEIVKRGGWVIRLGDRSMRPLPQMERVIDYPHTSAKSDWMDIFLVAQSKFFLGMASGMNAVPIPFGVPSVLTNVSPMNGIPVCSSDLYIPKLIKSHKDGRYLSFPEALHPPFDYLFNTYAYQQYGVSMVDNSAEEIRDVVLEMIERLEGKCLYDDQDKMRQNQFKAIAERLEPHGIGGQIGRNFLKTYQHLLR